MTIIHIDTLEDPRLDAYARLTEVQLRSKLEPEKGIFIAESQKVIQRAFDAGYEPVSVLMEEKWLAHMEPLIFTMEKANPSLPIFIASHGELEMLAGFEVTRGAMAAFKRPKLLGVEELVQDASRIAVLENITNHTNVGAMFRSAAALGIDAVLVTPACFDPLYRRAVRVSMGTVFQVPWTRIGEEGASHGRWAKDGIALLHNLGFKCAAMALSDDSVALDHALLKTEPKLAIILGTEGDGLYRETIELSDYVVRIPMAHDVDSLNVAAASAVAFWELRDKSGFNEHE